MGVAAAVGWVVAVAAVVVAAVVVVAAAAQPAPNSPTMTYVDALLWLLLLLLLPGTPPLQISPPPHTPTAQKAKANVEEFLRDFRTVPVRKGVPGEAKYVSLVAALTEKQVDPKYAVRIQVDLDDVQMFSPELVRDIQQNTRRYSALFSAAIDDMLPPIQRTIGGDDSADAVLLATR